MTIEFQCSPGLDYILLRRCDDKAFDVPNGVVRDLEGLLADPYLADIGFFEPVEHPSEGEMLTMAIPVTFFKLPGSSFRLPPPGLGEHTRPILRELGLSDAEIDEIAT
jgi:formyl-CoA transferase